MCPSAADIIAVSSPIAAMSTVTWPPSHHPTDGGHNETREPSAQALREALATHTRKRQADCGGNDASKDCDKQIWRVSASRTLATHVGYRAHVFRV